VNEEVSELSILGIEDSSSIQMVVVENPTGQQ